MTPYQRRLTPITKRMAEDRKIRHLAQSTIDAYTYHVGKFAEFLGKPLKKATPDRPYASTSIQKAIKAAAARANIKKNVTPHVLRHSYATGLLEAGVDILTISRLLGHASFTTTMVYLHVRQPHLDSTPSPLDWLPVRQLPGWQQPKQDDNNSQDRPS